MLGAGGDGSRCREGGCETADSRCSGEAVADRRRSRPVLGGVVDEVSRDSPADTGGTASVGRTASSGVVDLAACRPGPERRVERAADSTVRWRRPGADRCSGIEGGVGRGPVPAFSDAGMARVTGPSPDLLAGPDLPACPGPGSTRATSAGPVAPVRGAAGCGSSSMRPGGAAAASMTSRCGAGTRVIDRTVAPGGGTDAEDGRAVPGVVSRGDVVAARTWLGAPARGNGPGSVDPCRESTPVSVSSGGSSAAAPPGPAERAARWCRKVLSAPVPGTCRGPAGGPRRVSPARVMGAR